MAEELTKEEKETLLKDDEVPDEEIIADVEDFLKYDEGVNPPELTSEEEEEAEAKRVAKEGIDADKKEEKKVEDEKVDDKPEDKKEDEKVDDEKKEETPPDTEAIIEMLSEAALKGPPIVEKKEEEKVEKPEDEKVEVKEVEVKEDEVKEAIKSMIPEMTEDEYAELFRDKDKFFGVMQKMVENITETVSKKHATQIAEGYYKDLPSVISQAVRQTTTLQKQSEDFYKANEDLKPNHKFVTYTAKVIQAKNPDWDLAKVLEQTEKDVRTTLGKAKASDDKVEDEVDKEEKETPGFTDKPKGKKPKVKEKLTEEEQEVLDMYEHAREN